MYAWRDDELTADDVENASVAIRRTPELTGVAKIKMQKRSKHSGAQGVFGRRIVSHRAGECLWDVYAEERIC